MAPRHRHAALLALLLSACSGLATSANGSLELRAETPPAVAAERVARAVRELLPFADPVPYAGGAPVTLRPGEAALVRYEARRDEWLPVATHRIRLTGPPPGRLSEEPAEGLDGFGLARTGSLELHVVPADGGTHIRGWAPHELLDALRRTLARALSERPGEPVCLERAREAALSGDPREARKRLAAAVLLGDPAERAHALATLTIPSTARQARHLARLLLDHEADIRGARTLLHTATRVSPVPELDYRLYAELFRRLEQTEPARAATLLAREYAAAAARPTR